MPTQESATEFKESKGYKLLSNNKFVLVRGVRGRNSYRLLWEECKDLDVTAY